MKPSDLKAVVAWSGGMYDLATRVKGIGMYPPFIKATFGEGEEAQRAASPASFVANAKDGPAFLFASVDDEKSRESRDATEQMVSSIKAAGGKVESVILKDRNHFMANHMVGAEGDKTGEVLVKFVKKVSGQ
jgi:dipeptidyl aminopeptidase/acylaminoacyl peptidase